MNKYKILILLSLIAIGMTTESIVYASCRGCCQGHGGVRCDGPAASCADGSAMSETCQDSCEMCQILDDANNGNCTGCCRGHGGIADSGESCADGSPMTSACTGCTPSEPEKEFASKEDIEAAKAEKAANKAEAEAAAAAAKAEKKAAAEAKKAEDEASRTAKEAERTAKAEAAAKAKEEKAAEAKAKKEKKKEEAEIRKAAKKQAAKDKKYATGSCKGCCSGHGGIDCNGYFGMTATCKDGSDIDSFCLFLMGANLCKMCNAFGNEEYNGTCDPTLNECNGGTDITPYN